MFFVFKPDTSAFTVYVLSHIGGAKKTKNKQWLAQQVNEGK